MRRNFGVAVGCFRSAFVILRIGVKLAIRTFTYPLARLDPDASFDAFAELETRQRPNGETGAVHAAAIIDAGGQLQAREDVGRHNALDKAVGGVLRAGLEPRTLRVTSRASYEIVHKAAQVGIGLVAAISAPTALAVRVAEEAGVMLIGLVRGRRLTIYAGDL